MFRVSSPLDELEGLGRECDLPRKRPVRWSANMVLSMSCTARDGRGFVHLVRFGIQEGAIVTAWALFFSSGGGWVVPHGLSARSRVSRFVLN